jgi:hypothetical protein
MDLVSLRNTSARIARRHHGADLPSSVELKKTAPPK